MGYLTLMADDVLMALETFPPDLRLAVAETAPQPDWDEYVTGRYNETKKKDTSVLGGGKPSIVASAARPGATQWRVDEQDTSPSAPSASSASGSGAGNSGSNHSGVQGEFRRATSARPTKGNSADFRAAFADDDDDDDDDFTPSGHPHVSRIYTFAPTEHAWLTDWAATVVRAVPRAGDAFSGRVRVVLVARSLGRRRQRLARAVAFRPRQATARVHPSSTTPAQAAERQRVRGELITRAFSVVWHAAHRRTTGPGLVCA